MTPKHVQEVEKEIAMHTQQFDNSMLSKSDKSEVPKVDDKAVDSPSGVDKIAVKESKDDASNTKVEEKRLDTVTVIKLQTPPLQSFQVMQFIRLAGIIFLSSYTGTLISIRRYTTNTTSALI